MIPTHRGRRRLTHRRRAELALEDLTDPDAHDALRNYINQLQRRADTAEATSKAWRAKTRALLNLISADQREEPEDMKDMEEGQAHGVAQKIGALVLAQADRDERKYLEEVKAIFVAAGSPIAAVGALTATIGNLMQHYEGPEWRRALEGALLGFEIDRSDQ